MPDENDNWLEPLLEDHMSREPAEFDFQQWANKYPDEAQLLNRGYEDSGQTTKTRIQFLWRCIMQSRVTRYSAAAVVALAMALVLLGPFGTPGNGGVVLADVREKVADIETMVIRGTKTFMHPGDDGDVFEFDGMKCEFDLVKHFSKQHGFTEKAYVHGNLFYRITFNLPKQQTLIVFPPYKKYLRFASTDEVAKILEKFATPNGVFDLLLASDYKELGRDKIDGVEVEAFEFQSPGPFREILPKPVFDIQSYTGKVWVGIEEQLPIRIEGNLVIGKSLMTVFNELNLHEVNVLDKYNIELDESIFDPDPPEGYTEFTFSDILQVIPAEAKAGAAFMGLVPAGFLFWKRRRKRATTRPT
ncbi:MAG: hypothetical protein JSU70_22755 [Phycisphaerales bacterium]|nr:MAG: hypothetical protein JSU70_22755 [Phycisphaerales bacterium]